MEAIVNSIGWWNGFSNSSVYACKLLWCEYHRSLYVVNIAHYIHLKGRQALKHINSLYHY